VQARPLSKSLFRVSTYGKGVNRIRPQGQMSGEGAILRGKKGVLPS